MLYLTDIKLPRCNKRNESFLCATFTPKSRGKFVNPEVNEALFILLKRDCSFSTLQEMKRNISFSGNFAKVLNK